MTSASEEAPDTAPIYSGSDVGTEKQRMSRPDDARALRSRRALHAALLALVAEKSLEQISIRDITAQAGVSYPVFFRRYQSKEELLEDIATEEVRQLLSLTMPVFDERQDDASLFVLCRYIAEHRALWEPLLTGGAASAMREEFRRIAQGVGESDRRINPWLPVDLAAAFVVSGLFEILAWWMRQPAHYPIENVVKLIDVLVVSSTGRLVDIQMLPVAAHD